MAHMLMDLRTIFPSSTRLSTEAKGMDLARSLGVPQLFLDVHAQTS